MGKIPYSRFLADTATEQAGSMTGQKGYNSITAQVYKYCGREAKVDIFVMSGVP